jgi:hypothetical protein
MTLAQSRDLPPSLGAKSAAKSAAEIDRVAREGTIRLAIHDASRIEWSFAVPLPDAAESGYVMSAELLVPSNTFVPHSPWEQLQMYSRLDGAGSGDAPAPARGADRHLPTVDVIRRETVARASALADLGRLFARHCRLGGSLFAMAAHSDLEACLREALAAAAELAVEERRERIEPVDLSRERLLADEWISARYIELLASAERSLAGVLESRTPHLQELAPAIDRLQDEVADALAAEMKHRETCGYLLALAGDGPHALERYLDRASTLKKHFQEVLFLEMDSRRPAERIQLWARVVATLLAGTLAFFLQLQLTLHATRSSEVGSGLTALAVVAGLSYAARDRFKESGREWLAGKMARLYAQRVTVLRLPSRRSNRRSIVATARESVEESRVRSHDPLLSSAVTSVKYVQRAVLRPQPALRAEGTSRVKLVFRYDLSPLFARMDDAVKKLPILTPGSRRVRFADAPRCYRMQVRLTLNVDGRTEAVHQTLVLSKRGLERIEEIG